MMMLLQTFCILAGLYWFNIWWKLNSFWSNNRLLQIHIALMSYLSLTRWSNVQAGIDISILTNWNLYIQSCHVVWLEMIFLSTFFSTCCLLVKKRPWWFPIEWVICSFDSISRWALGYHYLPNLLACLEFICNGTRWITKPRRVWCHIGV